MIFTKYPGQAQEARKKLEAAEAALILGEVPSLEEYPLGDYTSWQGKEANNNSVGVYLIAPGKENGYTVKTANKVRHGSEDVWYNVIQEAVKTPVEFKIYVTGNGIRNLDVTGKITFPFAFSVRRPGREDQGWKQVSI